MPQIKIYSTTTCVYCKMLKGYLPSKNINFEEVLLDKQPEQVQEFVDLSGQMGVPFTHIKMDDGREEKILGFDRARFDSVLGLA